MWLHQHKDRKNNTWVAAEQELVTRLQEEKDSLNPEGEEGLLLCVLQRQHMRMHIITSPYTRGTYFSMYYVLPIVIKKKNLAGLLL